MNSKANGSPIALVPLIAVYRYTIRSKLVDGAKEKFQK